MFWPQLCILNATGAAKLKALQADHSTILSVLVYAIFLKSEAVMCEDDIYVAVGAGSQFSISRSLALVYFYTHLEVVHMSASIWNLKLRTRHGYCSTLIFHNWSRFREDESLFCSFLQMYSYSTTIPPPLPRQLGYFTTSICEVWSSRLGTVDSVDRIVDISQFSWLNWCGGHGSSVLMGSSVTFCFSKHGW